MYPCPGFSCFVTDFIDRIVAPAVYIPGLQDAQCPIVHLRDSVCPYPSIFVCGNRLDLFPAKTQDGERRSHRGMGIFTDQNVQGWSVSHPILFNIIAQSIEQTVSGGGQCTESGVGGAGHKSYRSPLFQPQQFREPPFTDFLQGCSDRRHDSQSTVLVPCICDPLGGVSDQQKPAVDKSEIPPPI